MSCEIGDNIQCQAKGLANARGQSGALYSHFRERPPAKNQDWIKKNVGNTAGHHADHGQDHFPNRLKDLFHGHGNGYKDRKSKGDSGVSHAYIDHLRICGKQAEKEGHDRNASNHQHKPMNGIVHDALHGCCIGFLRILGAQMVGNHSVCTNGKADGNGVDHVLYGEYQR